VEDNGTISVKKKTDGSVRLDSLLEKHRVLLVLALTRTCRVNGDGFLTQAISGILLCDDNFVL